MPALRRLRPAAAASWPGWCLLCCLLGGGLAARSCQTCGPDCACRSLPGAACAVDCAARGLARPPGPPWPPATLSLNLSSNNISALNAKTFAHLTSLTKLDLSNNKISTLEDGVFDNLFNLSEINLSLNPFLCDCNLAWFPSWVDRRKVKIVRPLDTKCAQPPEAANLPLFNVSFTDTTCGADYIACLTDNTTGLADSVVRFVYNLPQNWTKEICSAHCYVEGQDYGGFSDDGHCLCGAALEPNSSTDCLPFCTELFPRPVCGGPSIVSDVFLAQLPISLAGPRPPSSLYQAVAFSASVPLAISTLQWDFGDQTKLFNTTKAAVLHKYSLPGRYNVTATAAAGSHFTSAQTEIEVVAPPAKIELQCPPLVKTNESLQLQIRNRGGTGLSAVYSIMAQDGETEREVHPMCPTDSVVFPGNRHCYQLVAEKAEWLEAQRHCQEFGNGDLAFVSSPEIQSFLVSQVTRSLDVWIGFNDLARPGDPRQREGFDLQSCQNWLPGEPHPSNADHCVRMGPTGQCNTDLCMAKHSYVCEYKPQEILLNTEYFFLGALAFDVHAAVSNVTEKYHLSAPSGLVERMAFPGWVFRQRGFLVALEFVTQELRHTVQVRFQVHRPELGEDCEETTNITGLPLASQGNGTRSPLDCSAGFQWCPWSNACLPLESCCDPAMCANGSAASKADPNPCLHENHLRNRLLEESFFDVLPGPSKQYLLLFRGKDAFVGPNDTISIQHDAGPGAFLLCHPSPVPSDPISYLTSTSSDWDPGFLAHDAASSWRNDSVCFLRVLFMAEETVPIIGRENSGVDRYGLYSVRATVDNGVFTTNLSCNFWAVPPVQGLCVIYPAVQDGKIYVPTNRTWLVVKVSSRVNASAGWLGGNQSFPFERHCPPTVAPLTAECARETKDSWFSVITLDGIGQNFSTVVLWAENAVSSQNISIMVKAEEPIRGLRATPDPETRVLLNKRVSYVPMMDAGSDVTFRWTVDDKPSFTFYNNVFKVVYQTPAVYKLSLTASNHVSNVTVNYNITVEKMNRMKDLMVSEIPSLIPQNTTVDLSAVVTVDSAVDATFLWDFGDDEQIVFQFMPPYNESFLVPDPNVHQVVIAQNVSHIYQEPGQYTLIVSVFNEFENLTYSTAVHIYTCLLDVTMEAKTEVLVAGHPVTFEAYPLPSRFGVSYTWDFGDGCTVFVESQPTIVHSYSQKGMYNVSLQANNSISAVEVFELYRVFEEISGLRVTLNEAMELRTPVEVNASVETGDNITWIFDMGDGTILESSVGSVKHIYLKEANCTVNVTAVNPVNSVSQAVPVQIFVLMVLKIEPSSCILEHPEVQLTAYVSGDPANYIFDWTFGDGSSNVTVDGDPMVIHNFTRSGVFSLSLVLSSKVNKAHYYTVVCVEPEITNVTLFSPPFVMLGNESKFQVTASPPYNYCYFWDFGANDSARFGGTEVSYTYKIPGNYLVTVTVSNNVSFNNDTAIVKVLEPVGVAKIESNGSKVLELNQIYLFSANVSGTKVSYLWDFGDGTSQLGKFITHSYNKTGIYTISLRGWNEVSHTEARLNMTVKRRLQGLAINASKTIVPLNGSVSFVATLLAGTAVRYSWILCDRCTPIPGTSTISYTFRSVGTFNVIVTVENEIGSLQDSIFISVLQQIEGLQVTSSDLLEDTFFPTNKTLHLQAAVREGTNISYTWSALKESYSVQTFTGKTFSLLVMEAGVYVIHLNATNMLGSLAVNKTVEFIEQIGVLKPAASPNPVAVNVSINISISVTAGTGLVYTWYLEDGVILLTSSPFITYSFQSPGIKVIMVTAENKFGSANATLLVFVQEPVVGLKIQAVSLDSSYVRSGSVVNFRGELERGTDIAWKWKMLNRTLSGQRVALEFPTVGFFSVCLNASNEVSWEAACHNITVQEAVQGLQLRMNKEVVEPGEEVSFVIEMSSGSSVSYGVSIGGDRMVALNTSIFTHAFAQVGDYKVKVTAENHVSRVQVEVLIVVLEPVSGLWIVDCCEPGTPTGIERHFTAEIETGSRVSYLWQFSLEEELGHSQVVLEGKSVSYTPEVAGLLEIHLTAFNGLGNLNISVVIHVQDPIVQFSLKSIEPFANRSALFEASVFPSVRQVTFWWQFGDGSPAQKSLVAFASHTYLRPGDYLVEVNATNLISFAITHLTVTVRVLECEEPEAELVLPAQVVMKRSQKNYLEAQIDLRGCFRYQTEYLWEIYRTSSCLQLRGANKVYLPAVDVSRPQLVVPKLALDLGNYCFKFLVSFGDTPLAKSIFANVTVVPNKLVPIIDGGSYRVWSSTRDLILDGEKSYDPNLEDREQTPLHYRWTCVSSTKSSSGECALSFSATGGVVTISRAILETDVEYTFDLTVWKTEMNPEATNQTVLIKEGTVPIVALECVSCKAQSVYEVSRSSYVYLEGTCLNCQNNSKLGRWAAHSFKNKTLVLDKTTTSTGNVGMNLVLRPGALKDGEGYTFTFHITDLAMGEEGYASIDLFPNQPPFGGFCRLSPLGHVQALTAKVHFECTGWRDNEDEDTPLVYILLATRCRTGHCEEFWVYKGSHSEHAAFLLPGFRDGASLVHISVLVQDQLGATVVALNSTMAITLPSTPDGFHSLPQWLYNQTDVVLQGLVKQSDPQQVIEYSLALITILNEYERFMHSEARAEDEENFSAWTRRNITETLISMKVNTVDDIQQITAALAQCTVANKEFVCRACLTETLKKLESMLSILQGETLQGTMTPTSIADNILSIMGDLIHLVNTVPQPSKSQGLNSGQNHVQVASKAYALSTDLMRILMKSRVLNEEPLELVSSDIMAKGKRSDPFGLLCYEGSPSCRFSIPPAFNTTFSDLTDVVQVMIRVDYNPFPFGYILNYTVSSEVASMEFQSNNGTEIPVGSLDPERAITVMVSDPAAKNITAGTVMVEERKSVNVVLTTENGNREAGLYFQVTFSVLNDRYVSYEPEPFIAVYLHRSPQPNEHNCTASKKIRLEDMNRMAEGDPRHYTFFVSPVTDAAVRDYYLNITNHFLWSPVEVTLGLYSSLCQYFSKEEECWKTEGMAPLEGTTPNRAVCLTQHLTAFGASLFVPPHSVQFIRPPPGPGLNYIVLLTCAICFVTYSVAAVIVHKLDLIDVNRVGVIPFCGKNGLYKYEILVKTGWGTGSGTTAHVGITLYGMDHKSGHRHLDSEDAFHRNSLDIFQIATEQSLGTVWKIRIWHDNKGLSPSWYLQHVVIRDLQTCKSFHFLVNDWLSVESEENNGLVEREVFAASEANLRSFLRIFLSELQRGFFEKHIWLSLWDRPPRSRFTRVQRASCCCLLVFLFLCANAVWYGVVGDVNFSNVAVSTLIPVSSETVSVGLVSSLVVYPLYLLLLFLFRMARSKVSVSQSLTHSDQQSLEIDNYLDSSLLESSFLTFPGLRTEAFSEQTKTDVFLDDSKSLIRWHSNEALPNWPDLLSDPSIMGNTIQKLKRGRTSRHLGLEAPLATEEDGLSVGFPQAQTRYFSASDEDLIRQILADGAGSISHLQDIGSYARVETDLISGLSSMLGEKTEAIMMQRLNVAAPSRELNCSAKSTRTVADHALRKRLLPSWCSHLAHALSLALLAICFGVSAWIGVTFTSSVALMWLISGIFSFLSSFLFWEPLKVLLEALYFSLVVKRLHPEEDDTLVEYPLVEHISEKIGKVRPPQGFALFQAKEEARKVKLLHRMLKNFLIYMLFLLATLLTNYGDTSLNSRAFLLQSSIKQQMASDQFLRIKRPDEFWVWMSRGLLPYLYNNHSGSGSCSTTLGTPRLRQIRLQEAECLDPVDSLLSETDPPAAGKKGAFCSDSFDTSIYAVGWKRISDNLTQRWIHSPPESTGVWFWGYLSFYDSSGYIQELGTTFEESKARLDFLQQNNWISNMSRAVFVELTQYNPGLALLAVVTLRLEFPMAGHVLPAVAVGSIPVLPLNGGVTVQLLMMVVLMIVVVHFVVSESLSIKKAGRAYFALATSYSQWLLILLATCTVGVYASQATATGRQWATYLKNRHGFTSFHQVASLNATFRCLAAVLLFLLTVKASHQLRFIRQWSTFGRTLRRSAKELFATGLAFGILTFAYAQLGFLLFSSRLESFCTFSGSLQLLFTALRSSVNLHFRLPEPVGLSHLFCASYIALELWVVLRLFTTVLIHHYQETRFEMYRPAFESQDYEMVELFVRRLKIWMGVSKAKEFRHKVRFEGMEPLPSRSSSQDSRSLRGPTPSAVSDSASTSSSQLDGLSLAPSARDSSEADSDIQHLLSLLEILLVQFDRVNEATEDVYHIECRLEAARSWRVRKRDTQRAELPGNGHRPMPANLGLPSTQMGPSSSWLQPSGPLSSSVPSRIAQGSQGISVASSLLSPHKTYASLMPAARRKKKPLRANNRVHPSGK